MPQTKSSTTTPTSPQRQRSGNLRCAALWLVAACALALGTGVKLPLPPTACASPVSERAVAIPPGHHLSKRSFFNIQCKGVYDKSIFARLARICEDCYNLFREAQLHTLCTKDCFTSEYFKGCLEALQLTDETEQIQTWIKQLHGASGGFRTVEAPGAEEKISPLKKSLNASLLNILRAV